MLKRMRYFFNPNALRKFTDGKPYLGKYETGLYPGASDEMPDEHRRLGERIAATIQPLSTSGKPDARKGRIVALVMGHSNCQMYFEAFRFFLQEQARDLVPRFALLNAAVGGQQLPEISTLRGPVWDKAKMLLRRDGLSAKQVQALFFHTTYHGAGNNEEAPPGKFPETMLRMKRDLVKVLRRCLALYPNLKIAYLTCDGFRFYTRFEPHVWREAFAFKWLIESQIRRQPGTECEGKNRRLPWLSWGPYIWDNTWDTWRFTDGVHPSAIAQAIFAGKYWNHLAHDPVTRAWLFRTSS